MRAVVTRVRSASVAIDGTTVGQIGPGFLILLGITQDDTPALCRKLAEKVLGLRIFRDENDKMNLSLLDIGGGALVVSQFTLYGDCRKGRRPGFSDAAEPELADRLYEKFVELLRLQGVRQVETGRFAADMLVKLENDGPVTLMLESPDD